MPVFDICNVCFPQQEERLLFTIHVRQVAQRGGAGGGGVYSVQLVTIKAAIAAICCCCLRCRCQANHLQGFFQYAEHA